MILTTRKQFQSLISLNENGEYIARYSNWRIHSVFQPIFGRSHKIVGVEALVRITTLEGKSVRPDLFFSSTEISIKDKINLDKLSRVIHIRNFAISEYKKLKLFLNILPSVSEYFALHDVNNCLLSNRLNELNIDRSQVIMEIVELNANNEYLFLEAIKKLSTSGYSIAIDDFGACASTMERVKSLQPNIVKLDRELLLEHMSGQTNRLLEGIKLARSIGAKVIVEGIETQQHYDSMIKLNLDMYQGFYLGTPEAIRTDVKEVV
ncbi:EAL domain-containing protein [Vibrio sp. ZSDE26]|uniref:EAL domain-containing protein n=1 Tax=Vibrio amylolyticus TaxID=2847292 RepID=A0A9X1XLH7_9VIBR|nr:EAL domain-containing protein [Vibrio amylolyticus]MCK6263908.1 EAL domain-containing protein [Vibrio amylolyticus]